MKCSLREIWHFARKSVRRLKEKMTDDTKTTHKGERKSSSVASPKGCAIKTLVEAYIRNELIDIPWVPDFVERRIYTRIMETVLDKIEQIASDVEVPFLGHALKVDFDPVAGIAGNLRDMKEETKTKEETQKKRREEREEREAWEEPKENEKKTDDGVGATVTSRDDGEDGDEDIIIDRLVHRFMEANVVQSSLHIPYFGFLTQGLERGFYRNVLRMCIGLLKDILHESSVDVLGHRITPHISVNNFFFLSSPSLLSPSAGVEGGERREENEETRLAIHDIVESIMERNAQEGFTGMSLIPDSIERYLYTRAFGIVLALVSESLETLRINVFHHRLTFRLEGGSTPP